MKPIFIDKDITVLSGAEAEKALADKNDLKFVNDGRGVTAVPRERWAEAQYAERLHWMRHGIRSIADRNDHHLENFDHYRVLEGMRFHHAIELGCGPFTNLRLIGLHCSIDRCDLLDPLIEEYLSHPNCTYTRQSLMLARHLSDENMLNRILGHFCTGPFNQLRKRINPHVPVGSLIPSAIETMPADTTYDLLCIINVIEHCYDLDLVFRNIAAVLEPGGILVFHDRYYDEADVPELLASHYDAAHPLRVDRKIIDDFLQEHFVPLFSNVTTQTNFLKETDEKISFDTIYFIGRKKA